MPDAITSQTVEIALDQILLNDNNPRGGINWEYVDALAASMSVDGQKTDIKVRPDNGKFRNVGGDHRVLAARKLGWTTIKGIILNITAEEAELEGHLDNQGQPKTWFSDYKAVEAAHARYPQMSQGEVGAKVIVPRQYVNRAYQLMPLLNAGAREAICQNLTGSGKYKVPETALFALTDLATGQPGGLDRIASTLNVVITRQMKEAEVKKLVEWVKAGNPPQTYAPAPKTPKEPKPKTDPGPSPEVIDQLIELAEQAGVAKGRGEDPQPAQDKLKALRESLANQSQPSTPAAPANGHYREPLAQSPQLVASAQTKIYLFRDWLAGVNVIHKIQQKIAKGENPTFMESMVLGGYRIGQGAGWLWKHLLKPMLEPAWHQVKKSLGKTFGWIFGILITIVVICGLALLVWNFLLHGFHPLNWVESKIESVFHHESSSSEPTPIPTVQPSVSAILPKVEAVVAHLEPKKKIEKTTPTITYQPAVSFAPVASPSKTLFDPKILEIEMAAIPQNSIVKDYPFTPDETMPGDLAVSRLQDLTDTDRYTMKMGNSTEKIISLTPTTTNLILNYKSGDALGGFLDGSGQLNFFWEDVKYVHTNAIYSGALVQSNPAAQLEASPQMYQCSLVVSGAKYPLTIQCARPEDLEHLVSTLEYFIRNSRLGHDAQPAGLPYLDQGLVFNNQCLVEKLWSNSPADKAGVSLGEMIWSLDKNAYLQPERKALEKQLASLVAGTYNLFVVTPSDRDKGMIKMNQTHSSDFNPKRQKTLLIVD